MFNSFVEWMRYSITAQARSMKSCQGKFASKIEYEKLLKNVFSQCSRIMKKNSIIYVRTDARKFTFKTTLEALRAAFPKKSLKTYRRPFTKKTQTALYGDKSEKPGEIDIILQ